MTDQNLNYPNKTLRALILPFKRCMKTPVHSTARDYKSALRNECCYGRLGSTGHKGYLLVSVFNFI
jgi:hypothetical protein